MKNTMLCYSVGALLYCPANNESIVNSLVNEKYGQQFSLALCLEDTIRDDLVNKAECQLSNSLHRLLDESMTKQFYMPKIFIRVREPQQIIRLRHQLGTSLSLLTGFILPKFCIENADNYINAILDVNAQCHQSLYMMPILESPSMINMLNRYNILYNIKGKLDQVNDLVLNMRVGGNDLCHAFGFRRHSNETIYDIKPIATILSDIMVIYGIDYVVSGPVWEYYNGEGWRTGLSNELKLDKLNGFIGKTVIHPNQISMVNQSLAVCKADYDDAISILNWSNNISALVSSSANSERMNEYKTHYNWANKIIILSQIYGIVE